MKRLILASKVAAFSLALAAFVVGLTGMAMTAEAQPEVPSDLELGAAYCLGFSELQDRVFYWRCSSSRT